MEGIGDKGDETKKKKKCEDDTQGLTGSTGPSSAGASESCAPLKMHYMFTNSAKSSFGCT